MNVLMEDISKTELTLIQITASTAHLHGLLPLHGPILK